MSGPLAPSLALSTYHTQHTVEWVSKHNLVWACLLMRTAGVAPVVILIYEVDLLFASGDVATPIQVFSRRSNEMCWLDKK